MKNLHDFFQNVFLNPYKIGWISKIKTQSYKCYLQAKSRLGFIKFTLTTNVNNTGESRNIYVK